MEKMQILNLTQHKATPEQSASGVVDVEEVGYEGTEREELVKLLSFETLPSGLEVEHRAGEIARLASDLGAYQVMIGGAPFLMAPLERALSREGIQALYAFSARESVETVQPDGSVEKKSVFRHRGFIPVL